MTRADLIAEINAADAPEVARRNAVAFVERLTDRQAATLELYGLQPSVGIRLEPTNGNLGVQFDVAGWEIFGDFIEGTGPLPATVAEMLTGIPGDDATGNSLETTIAEVNELHLNHLRLMGWTVTPPEGR